MSTHIFFLNKKGLLLLWFYLLRENSNPVELYANNNFYLTFLSFFFVMNKSEGLLFYSISEKKMK